MAKRYDLQREISRVRAEFPPFEIQLPEIPGDEHHDGFQPDVAVIPATQNMSDEAVTLASTNPVLAAKSVLGDKWEHFAAAGGTGNVFWNIVQQHNQEALGESSPSDGS